VLCDCLLADPPLQLRDLPLSLRRSLGVLAGLFLCLGNGPFQDPQQPLGIGVEPRRAELEGVPARQLSQALWQLTGPGHLGPFNQDGDDADVTCQGGLDLQPDEVARVIQPSPAIRAGNRQPSAADQREQNVAGLDRCCDHLDEIIAQLNRVDVLKDLISAKVAGKPVKQPCGRIGGILTAVGHEDPARNLTGGCTHHAAFATSPP
jgi:hypothetical protein